MKFRVPVRLLSAAIVVTFGVACGATPGTSSGNDSSPAAIVPDADFSAKLDLQSIRATSACQSFAADADAEAAGDATTDDETGTDSDAKPSKIDMDKLMEMTGLRPEDLLAVVVSADLAGVDLDAPEPDIETANAVVGVHIAKALSTAKLSAALKASAPAQASQVSDVDLSGTPAILIRAEDENEPDIYAASGPGDTTLFVAANSASLLAALERAASGNHISLPAPLENVRKALPADAQVTIAFLAPQELRDKIVTQLEEAKQDPAAAMTASFADPFKNIQSLALAAQCGDELQISIAGDLGSDGAATQVATLLQTMALPMIKGTVAEWVGKPPSEIDDRFDVATEGPALRIGVRMTAEDLAALRAKQDHAGGDEGAGE
jgi:hypothetical protein